MPGLPLRIGKHGHILDLGVGGCFQTPTFRHCCSALWASICGLTCSVNWSTLFSWLWATLSTPTSQLAAPWGVYGPRMLMTQGNSLSLSLGVKSFISHALLTETLHPTFLPPWERNAFFLKGKTELASGRPGSSWGAASTLLLHLPPLGTNPVPAPYQLRLGQGWEVVLPPLECFGPSMVKTSFTSNLVMNWNKIFDPLPRRPRTDEDHVLLSPVCSLLYCILKDAHVVIDEASGRSFALVCTQVSSLILLPPCPWGWFSSNDFQCCGALSALDNLPEADF